MLAEVIDIEQEAVNKKSEAQKHFDKLKSAHLAFSKRSIEIGYYGFLMKSRNEFGILGFADESECRTAIGIGRSTWYKMLKIAECFQALSLADLSKMTVENLDLLKQVPEEDRMKPVMVKDSHYNTWFVAAEAESEANFEEAVAVYQAKANGRTADEARVNYKQPMFSGQRKVVEEGLKKFQEKNGLKDPGQALELLVTEATDGTNLIEAISRTISDLKPILDMWDKGMSTDELVEKQHKAIEDAISVLIRALQATKNEK